MSDAYGYGGGAPPRDQIVQALMAVQNPPPGGVVGAGSTPTPYAAPSGSVGNPNIAPPPGGIGNRGFAPPIPANPAAATQVPGGGIYGQMQNDMANQINQQPTGPQLPGGPGSLIPNLGQQLPPGGLPRY
jgi:hypothetical protein